MLVENIINDTQLSEHDALQDKITHLEHINHIMAHNLRGAASNIKLLSEILLDREEESEAESLLSEDDLSDHEAIHCIQRSSTAIINTLNDLMEVVNKDLNEQIRYDDCDVRAIVGNVTDHLNGVIHQKRATIAVHLAVKHIKYARAYLENLFYNMISNAIKYARPDVPLKLDIYARLKNGRAVLEFKDNGSGIDLEKFGSKIFKLNQVFHSGRESRGIGLYMTKNQIESLGGSIHIESKVNEGTSFTITL